MMKRIPTMKPIALAIGTALAAGATGAAQADANPFGATLLAAGYQVSTFADPATGGTPPKQADEKAKEGKCGEGKCGDKMKGKEGSCGGMGEHKHAKGEKIMEGKCGEGKCGEGKCGGAGMGEHKHAKGMKVSEGKCGEGKCGEGKCGGEMKAKEGSCGAEHMKGKEGSCGADKKDGKKDDKKG
jgi:uncharacterized low-complexity protein